MHRGKAKAMREKYQRPKVRDVGGKWKLTYRDYSSGTAKHRSKVWAKSVARSQRDAQRLADKFIDEVNAKNNDPRLYSPDERTLAGLHKKCKVLTWPLLKKPTRANYEYFLDQYLLPRFGERCIDELETDELQAFFNSFIGALSPYTIKNMHAALRALLAQAVVWRKIDRNPAIGVKLPKKKAVKRTVLLRYPQIKALIEWLPDPAKTIVTLIVLPPCELARRLRFAGMTSWAIASSSTSACMTATSMTLRRFTEAGKYPSMSRESLRLL